MIDKILSLTGGGGSGGGGGGTSLEGQTIVTATIAIGNSLQEQLDAANAQIAGICVRYMLQAPGGGSYFPFFGAAGSSPVIIPICKRSVDGNQTFDFSSPSVYQGGQIEVTMQISDATGEVFEIECNKIKDVVWDGANLSFTADWSPK